LDNYVFSYQVEENAKARLLKAKKRRVWGACVAILAQMKGPEGLMEASQRQMAQVFRRSLLAARTFKGLTSLKYRA
jgi:hypothetical protein